MIFLEKLRAEVRLFDALYSTSKVLIGPLLFADLCWGESSDELEGCKEPGIIFDRDGRTFVLMLIDHEIRYFAGVTDPNNNPNLVWEMGIFPSELAALSFGNEYLIDHQPISEIKVERKVVNFKER